MNKATPVVSGESWDPVFIAAVTKVRTHLPQNYQTYPLELLQSLAKLVMLSGIG